MVGRARSCGSRGSGRPPRAARRGSRDGASRAIAGSRATMSSASTSSAGGALVRPSTVRRQVEARLQRLDRARSRGRGCATAPSSPARSWCVSIASTSSSSNGSTRLGDAEGAVAHVAAGAAGDLAELGGGELADTGSRRTCGRRRRRRGRRRC